MAIGPSVVAYYHFSGRNFFMRYARVRKAVIITALIIGSGLEVGR